MSALLSHPFRIVGGVAAVVEQATDEANAEQLAVLMATRRGERVLVPAYGMTDPTFDELDEVELSVAVDVYGPPVTIEAVQTRYVGPTTQEVDVAFS